MKNPCATAIARASLAGILAGCAASNVGTSPLVPENLKVPEADLFDLSGKKIGKHYAGPTWESNDGSKVVGEVKARDDGPAPTAIPWLLLRAKSTSGNGAFSRTQAIQRLYTVGGQAPAESCN